MNASHESFAHADTLPMRKVELKKFSIDELLNESLGEVEAVIKMLEEERKILVKRQAAITAPEEGRLTEERQDTKYQILIQSNQIAAIQDRLLVLGNHLELAMRQSRSEFEVEKDLARESVSYALEALNKIAESNFKLNKEDDVGPIPVQYANVLGTLKDNIEPLLKKVYEHLGGREQN